MTKGYQIKKPLFQVGSTIFYDAIDEKESRSVFLQKVEGEYPSLTDLVHLLNDFEITQAHPINGILKSVKLLKTQSNIEVIKEFFNGIPLSIFIQKKKLSIPEVLAIAAKLAQIVQDVHAENIIHKNLNPENFLIQPKTLEIKLCNFGGATLLSREQPAVNNAEILQGSLFYISPEQTGRMNRSVDYRTDFYSLGITIYQMLCGKLPFIYSNAMELVHAHIAKLPEEPCLVDANIPKPLSDIVMKLIQKNAEDRYQSAAGLKEDLQKCLHLYQQSGNISYFMPGQFDYSPTFRISEKLYGRDLETKELKQAFETTSTGALNLILIAGYSGIGKTRLIFDIYHSIARHNGYFTSGKFDQYNRSNPYSAVAIAFGNLIRIFLAEGKADFENWRIKILQALEENGQVIIEVIPELELLIGKQPPVLKLSLNEAQARFFNLFKKFIQVLATPDHPLVIFLDDLQWADSSSFELLEVLFNGQDIRNILIIGAYRNNEVSGLHPLKLLLDRLSKIKQLVKTIILHELNLDQVNQLLADSLRLSYQNTRELADLLYHKTLGNPFFLIQFIQKLVQEQLIYFDLIKGKWKWKYEEINSMHITENVVDFLVIKLQTLTAETQQLLRLASCIGNRFDLDTLSIISEKDKSQISQLLWQTVKEELIQPVGSWSPYFDDQLWTELGINVSSKPVTQFVFQHDRIQQAAYTLIPEAEKKIVHLQIGRLLLQKFSTEEMQENLFDVVGHFNFSADLLTEKEELIYIAKLNLQAGKRAQQSNSFDLANIYFRAGMELMRPQDNPNLYNEYLAIRPENEYLCGNYEIAAQLFDTATLHATTNIQKAEVCARKMQLYENTGRQPEAIKVALMGLHLLGINLPEKPGQLRILQELIKTKYYLRNKSIDELKNNQELKSPELKLAMRILVNLWGPAYLSNQNLLALGILRMVIISTRYGNVPESALAYAFYGFVLSAQLKDYDNGFRYANLGMELNDKFADKILRSKVYVIYAGCVAHWKVNFSDLSNTTLKAYEAGIEVNDLIYAGYALCFNTKLSYLQGENLNILYNKLKDFTHFCRKISHRTAYQYMLTHVRLISKLRGIPDEEDIFLDDLDELTHKKTLIDYANKEGVFLPITFYYYFQLEWFYRIEDYEQALFYYNKIQVKENLAATLGFPESAILLFFHSLILIALARKDIKQKVKGFKRSIINNQKILKKLSLKSEGNYLAKYILVEAEINAIEGNFSAAAKLFGLAKDAARNSHILQDQALVNERAAAFYNEQGFTDICNSLLREALHHYQEWQANALVKQVEQKLEQAGITEMEINSSSPNILQHTGSESTSSSSLDLEIIINASITISSEVILNNLLQKLLNIIIFNAGAQSGYIILANNGKLYAAAEGKTEVESVKIIKDTPIDQVQELPQSVIYFVYHTTETVLLNDAVNDLRFSKDPYLIRNKPKSLLCHPILLHGECIAILYLENCLTSNVFTPAKIRILKLLSGQIAVSMQNALLYDKQMELNKAYQRFVPHDFIHTLGHESILQVRLGDNIDQEMTVMFCDIRSYTTITEGLSPKDSMALINDYLALVGPIVRKNNGFINHFLGDGFIGLFKDKPEDALRAAIQMNEAIARQSNQRAREGKPPIKIGIGLHKGHVSMGIIGDHERHDANVISDAVNVSSRLEGLTKFFGASVILSEETLLGIKDKEEFQFRYLGKFKMKGKERILAVHEMFDGDEPETRDKKKTTLETYKKGLNDYLNKNFPEAAISLKKVLAENSNDKLARHYLQSAAKLMVDAVPDNWDGVEQMNEK